MQEILEEVVRTIPYNNFGEFIYSKGEDYPIQLGGSCIHQNQVLSDKLRKEGYQVGFIDTNITQGNYHIVSIARERNRLFYLDPNFEQIDPIDITEVMAGREVEANTLSLCKNGKSSKLIGKKLSKSKFSIELYGIKRGEFGLITTNIYDLNRMKGSITNVPINRLLGRKSSLCLRLKNQDETTSYVNIYHQTGNMDIRIMGRENERKVRSKRDPEQFLKELKDISLKLGIKTHELQGAMYLGLSCYNSKHDTK